jgi:SEC-C motif/PBS lyase HEAT-like repeat
VSPLKNKQIEAATDAEALVSLLNQAGQQLPPRLRERILAFGPSVVPRLVAILEAEELASEGAPGEGWAPIHALELLGELRAAEAIEPMLRVLIREEWGTYLHDGALQVLPRLGPGVLEPALAAYAATDDPSAHFGLSSVLAKLGVRDERIYQALVGELEQDIVMGSAHLGEYGDPRALPLLLKALDDYEPVSDDPLENFGLPDLVQSIEELGGELTPEQRKKVDRIRAAQQPQRDRLASLLEGAVAQMDLESSPVRGARSLTPELRPARAARKVGRNDPCPCGSGKKYKKCCLDKETG